MAQKSLPTFPLNNKLQKRVARFWANVAQGGPSDCWEWQRFTDSVGYGHSRFEGVLWRSHRLAFFLAFQQYPNGVVMHSCDNPPCCNPEHLSLGTQQDNMTDKVNKGRMHQLKGEKVGSSVLTEGKVREIRERYGNGETIRSLARYAGIDPSTCRSALIGETWRHVK